MMQISEYKCSFYPNFKAIKLSPAEEKQCSMIINQISGTKISKPKLDNQLWQIFFKHLQVEAKKLSNKFYDATEALSDMSLLYSSALQDIESNGGTLSHILNSLNSFKKSASVFANRHEIPTLNDALGPHNDTCRVDFITEADIPIPDRDGAVEQAHETIESILSSEYLSEPQTRLIRDKSNGVSNAKIAKNEGLSIRTVEARMLSTKLKIQKNNGGLEQKYIDKLHDIKNILGIEINDNKLIDSSISHPNIYYMKNEIIKKNFDDAIKLFNLKKEKYAEAVSKHLVLVCMKPETMHNNIIELSKLFRLSQNMLVEMALVNPNLFYQKPSTIYNNFNEVTQIIKKNNDEVLQMFVKNPNILSYKPTTIKNKIVTISDIFGIPYEETICTVLNNPIILKYTDKKLLNKKNLKDYYLRISVNPQPCAKLMSTINHSEDCLCAGILAYIMAGKKEFYNENGKKFVEDYISENHNKILVYNIPNGAAVDEVIKYANNLSVQILGRNIFKFNIVKDSDELMSQYGTMLGVSDDEVAKSYSKLPYVFYKDTDSIKINIENLKNKFNCNNAEVAKIVLANPKLLYMQLEDTNNFLHEFSQLFDCELEDVSTNIINHPNFLTVAADTWRRKNAIKKYYFKCINYDYKNSDLCSTTVTISDKYYYAGILLNLMLKTTGQCNIKGENMLKNYISTLKDNIYEFDIPDGEIVYDIINYAIALSHEIHQKNIFKFNIVKE